MSRPGILVIGGGFLGRALACRLAASGSRVRVLSPHAATAGWPAGIDAVRGRQEDAGLVADCLRDHPVVIHAAWGTTPGSSAGRPALEAQAGLSPFLAFLETLQRFPGARLLFLSSGGTVYGEAGPLPVGEDHPLRPLSCHGAGKAAAECFLAARDPALTLILRPANVYGPGQALRSGFGVIRHLLQCASTDQPFQLWGDGEQLRDYLYIDDFTDALLRLVERPGVAGVLNIGSGAGTSLRELIARVEEGTGRTLRIAPQPPREGDVGRIILDIRRIRQAAGWAPATPLAEGIARMQRWLDAENGGQ